MDPRIAAAIKGFQAKVAQRSFDSISAQQARTTGDLPVKGPLWVSRVRFPPPDGDELRTTLLETIQRLGNGKEEYTLPLPTMVAVKGEWIGYKKESDTSGDARVRTQKENYAALMDDVSNKITLFHVHGGAFYFGSPASSRLPVSRLAKLTGGRCFAVKYRLSPQHPFPAALFDVFLAYLTLLYPPEDAYHEPVSARHIVFTGDSSGANLALAVLQIIQSLRAQQGNGVPVVHFNGKDVEVPYPAGYAAFGLLGDNTHCLPSYSANAKNDVLADPQPLLQSSFPSCEIWPTSPPRGDVYCEISAMCHVLISPVLHQDWSGMPPMLFLCGEEQMVDDSKMIAQQAAKQGVTVQWSEYELMPHLFAFIFLELPHSVHAFKSWAKFCQQCVLQPEKLEESAMVYGAVDLKGRKLCLRELLDVDYRELESRMRAKQAARKIWTGKGDCKASL